MKRLALLLLLAPFACSSDPAPGIIGPAPSGSSVTGSPSPSGSSATNPPDGGVASEGGPGTPTKPDANPPKPGTGSGGTGGPGPGEHDLSLVGTSVALHVPAGASSAPTPLLIILHGQGDTGRNFLNVYLYKNLPKDLIIAAPDANDDSTALQLESKLKTMFDVDTKREYALGFSQGGGYAAFLLFDASSANRFAAVGLASSGLAENPAYIPAASPGSPAVAVVIDPQDFNNTWGQGKTVMQDFVVQMQNKGYQSKIWLHNQGHTLAPTETQDALTWMFSQVK